MFYIPDSCYAAFRLHCGSVPAFHDVSEVPPERLLQAVWQHQRLLRDELTTTDGIPVRVLHPGFLNQEGGPDFRGAVIQFGEETPLTGDVEIDLYAHGWRGHGHDRNPAFHNVILHVIWNPASTVATVPPTIGIATKLDSPLNELGYWITTEDIEVLPAAWRGRCCAAFEGLSEGQVSTLLTEAGEIRFRAKATHFLARARQGGWEQSLWEGVFRALGYKHNAWPMQCLAEHRAHWQRARDAAGVLQARLLGLSGLLPADIAPVRLSSDQFIRNAWDQWWRERSEFVELTLPKSLWRLHGQRPANHPQRRLALASHWLAAGDLPARLEAWCSVDIPDGKLVSSLLERLRVPDDEFWNWHWTLRSARMSKPQPLLGSARLTDLAVNVVLPWLWMRAAEGKNNLLQQRVEQRYFSWPPAEDNVVLRLGRQRLLGKTSKRVLKSAAEQQGLIQITRDFCDRSNAACENCSFPEFVKAQLQPGARPES